MMLTDGCIYDRFEYTFRVQGGGLLPRFMTADESLLTISIDTNYLPFSDVYKLELIGSLNPHLVKTSLFTVNVLPYPNTGPPAFKTRIS